MGPLLFLIFINTLPTFVKTDRINIKLFADDTKIYISYPKHTHQFQDFQDAINKIFEWAESMQLQLALNKCAILHFGRTNPNHTYIMNGTPLANVTEYKDLGVTITSNLKFSHHCNKNKVAKNASLAAAMIHKSFNTRNRDILLQLYKTYAKPKLQYASIAWSPHLLRDIDQIEQIQRAFTRRLPGMNQYKGCYQQRLDVLQLDSLELCRLRTDLTWVYKIINGLVDLDPTDFFNFWHTKARSNTKKLYPTKCQNWLNCRRNFFSLRIVNVWNSLPDSVVNSESLAVFKNKLNKTDFTPFLRYFTSR